MSATRPTVLVTDAQDRCALAAIRCLGAAGYRVSGAAPSRWGTGLWSRWCAERRILPDPRVSIEAFARECGQVLAAEPPAVLLACRDETVYALSARRDVVPGGVLTGFPDHATVLRALDKACLAAEAERVGLAPPEQRVCRSLPDALGAAAEYGYPLLVKPVATIFERDGRIDRHPSAWVPEEADLRAAQARMGACIVQRRIDGQVLSFGGVCADGELIGVILSRYVRKWPAAAGHASLTESIAPSDALRARVQTLVAAIGWNGVFELELIQTAAGEIHAIDFNPRPYGSIALAAPAGAPLARVWCDWLLGRPVTPVSARSGVRFRSEEGELHHVVSRLRSRDLRGAIHVARPQPGIVHANVQLRDPMPAMAYAGFVARRVLERAHT